MEKILVSACLLGDKTRYDGQSNRFPFLDKLSQYYELVPFCPEVECGLPTPRSPAEIIRNEVVNQDGVNLTKLYNEAAIKAYRVCLFLGIKIAILKDGSPACGSRTIHNGKFDGGKIEGLGVTARYLISKDIKVYCENDNLEFLLKTETKKTRRSPIKKEENKYYANAIPKDEGYLAKDRKSSSRCFHKKSRYNEKGHQFDESFKKHDEKKPFYHGDQFHASYKKGKPSFSKGKGKNQSSDKPNSRNDRKSNHYQWGNKKMSHKEKSGYGHSNFHSFHKKEK